MSRSKLFLPNSLSPSKDVFLEDRPMFYAASAANTCYLPGCKIDTLCGLFYCILTGLRCSRHAHSQFTDERCFVFNHSTGIDDPADKCEAHF